MTGWIIVFLLGSLVIAWIISNKLDKYEASHEPVWLIVAYFFILAFIFVLLIYLLVI